MCLPPRVSLAFPSAAASSAMPRRRQTGFTLIELLAAIGIIAVLAILLIPGLKSFTARAQGSQCANNLRQIYVASMAYANENNGRSLPAQLLNGSTYTFWVNILRPYLGAESTTDTRLDAKFRCPAYTKGANLWAWGYGMNSRPGYEGASTVAPMYRYNWDETNVAVPSSLAKGSFQQAAITFPSKRLFLCDAIEWQINMTSSGALLDFPDYNRHGTNKCNALFYDGHIETVAKARLQQAVYDPGAN